MAKQTFKNWETLYKIFCECVILKKIEFAKFMLETFSYKDISSSTCLFNAIKNKDLKMAELLLKYRKTIDFRIQYGEVSFMDFAVLKDCETIVSLLATTGNGTFFHSFRPLYLAIKNKSQKSLLKIIEIVTGSGSRTLDQVYLNKHITFFIVTALTNHSFEALEVILNNIGSHDITHFGKYPETEPEDLIKNSTILHYCINIGYEEGFDDLIRHFGIDALNIRDKFGVSPLKYAIMHDCAHFVNKWII